MKVQCLALACFAVGAQAFGGFNRRNNATQTFQMVYHINTTITPNRCGQVSLNTRYDDTSIRMTRDYPIHKGTCADQGFTVAATPATLMSPRYAVVGSVKIALFNKPSKAAATKTIVGTAVATSTLSTLVAAVKAAGLVKTLNSRGNARFTVFAPTNAAFAKLGKVVPALLLPANKASLVKLLKYHVVSGSVLSSQLKNNQRVKTLEGQQLLVKVAGGKVTISNGSPKDVAKVTAANVACANGVVHIIDTVLIPPHFRIPHTTNQNGMVNNTVVNVIQKLRLSTLYTAVVKAGLAKTLSGRGPFTIFAPSNQAFNALAQTGQLAKILANKPLLIKILEYHVVKGQVLSTQLRQGMKLKTLDGPQKITVEVETKPRKAIYLDEIVQVIKADQKASNGVVHEINEVLVPPGIRLPAPNH